MKRYGWPFVWLLLWAASTPAGTIQLGLSDSHDAHPDDTRGALLTWSQMPQGWSWDQKGDWFNRLHIAVAGSLGHWKTDTNRSIDHSEKTLTTVAIAPEISIDIYKNQSVTPYFIMSAGPCYISTTKFADRRLGSHFVFQDILGIGASWSQHWLASLNYLHYSNANLARHNAGVDIKWLFRVGYRL